MLWFVHHGYKPGEETVILDRRLEVPFPPADPRFATHRRRFDIRLLPQVTIGSWWRECVFGLFEPVEFRLEEKSSKMPAARAVLWEMESYSARWGCPAAGLLDVQVRGELRRQGLAKFLLTQILRRLHEEYFGLVEVQAAAEDSAGVGLFASLGFERVDTGRAFTKELS